MQVVEEFFLPPLCYGVIGGKVTGHAKPDGIQDSTSLLRMFSLTNYNFFLD